MPKSTVYFVFGLCLTLILLAIPAGQGATQVQKPDKPTDTAIAVTAVELTTAYGDTTGGNKKYLDKTLIVEGKVLSSTTIGIALVALEGFKAPKEKEVRRVFCSMKPGIKASEFKRGDMVKIQGKCKGNGASSFVSVELKECEVVK